MKENALEELYQAGFGLLKEHITLFSLESTLAKQSIWPFFLSLGCLLLLCLSTWAALVVLGAYGIYCVTHSIGLTLLATTVLQFILLFATYLISKEYKRRLQFQETRAHLKNYLERDHE